MRRALASALGLLVLAALACGDEDEAPTGPDGPAGPTTGSIHVSLTMSGATWTPTGSPLQWTVNQPSS